jgi:hypothetical protein
MARYDKVEPLGGSFRALLAADWVADDGVPIGVGLDVNGRVVPGAGNSGIVGVVVVVRNTYIGSLFKAGEVVDVMTDGEIVELSDDDMPSGRAAGVAVFAVAATGVLTATASGNTRVGHTVEADRLVVRAAR